jgi:hypothetical protein
VKLTVVTSAFVIAVAVLAFALTVFYHAETRHTQPHNHKQPGNAYKNVNQFFQPHHAETYQVDKVETENADCHPVERADDTQYQRNYAEYVKCLVQQSVLLFFYCIGSMRGIFCYYTTSAARRLSSVTIADDICAEYKQQQVFRKQKSLRKAFTKKFFFVTMYSY